MNTPVAEMEAAPLRQQLVSRLQGLLAEPAHQIMTLSGAAGVGKSHLIRRVLAHTPHIAGKFETGKDATLAYAAFVQATRRMLNQLLSLPDRDFRSWQLALQQQVPIGALLPVLPELSYFQAPKALKRQEQMLADTLTLARPFERAFLKLWQCLIQVERQPVLSLVWLDDVQWMDEASMAFLAFLLEQQLPVHWMLTGRDTQAVEDLLASSQSHTPFRLHPLSESESEAFLLAQLGQPRDDSQELAAFLYQLSQGYPLELAWSIKELVQQQKIVYDQGWRYDGQLAELASGPHKGWEQLMQQQWQRLSPPVRTLLQTAVLLGPKFSPAMLRLALAGNSDGAFAADWAEALKSGFVEQAAEEARFAHDRLYEWVDQTLAVADRAPQQIRIARQLLASEQSPLELLVELLNAGHALLEPSEHSLRLEKNLSLIRCMLSQGALAQAQHLLDQIQAMLTPASPHFTDGQILRASLAYLSNDMASAEALLLDLLQHPLEDVLDAQLLLIVIYTQHNRYHEAVGFALDLLAAQGLTFDRDSQAAERVSQRCLQTVAQLSPAELAACAGAPAPAPFEARMQVIATVAVAIYNHDLHLYSLCILYALDQILAGQGTSRTASIYGAASLLLLNQSGDLTPALKLIQAAEQLARETGREDELTLIHCVMGDMISPWKLSFAQARDYLISSREAGERSGNLQFAGYACVFRGANLFMCAHPLAEFHDTILPELIQFNQRIQNYSPLDGLQAYSFLIEKLRSGRFDKPGQTDADFIADLRQRDSRADLSRYFTFKAFVLLLFGETNAALEAFQQSELDVYLPSSIVRVWHLLLRDLLQWRSGLSSAESHAANRLPLLPFDLRTLARLNPENFEVLHQIWLAAQPGRSAQEQIQAYHRAAVAARNQAQWHWEGFAHEQIAGLFQAQGLELPAQQSLLESLTAFQRWGATAKVLQLSAQLAPHYLQQLASSRPSYSQDVAEMLRICADFSRILDPESLQASILQVLKTQTEAEQIALILRVEDSTRWRSLTWQPDLPDCLQEIPSKVPADLLNYVARTHQSVLLPQQRERFSPGILTGLEGQHVLLPLVFQQSLMGIIYFQPQRSADMFGSQAEILLQALGGYLAGALHNAQRAQNLEASIALHTADLKRANQRLSQLLEERQEVLAIAAHDLKHPLGTLKLGISMLAQLEAGLAPEQRKLAFENLNQTIEDMNHNTERLLMIEHLEADLLRPQWKRIRLSEVLTPFLHSYEWKAREKQQQLVFRGFHWDAIVETDAGWLKMILNNLLENAIKFSPFEATIQVELALSAGQFAIRILDQGPGFKPDDQDRLFQKFGRLSARPTAGESSHGLGLFIVRRLVADLKGQIQVQPHAETGSVFEVVFPCLEPS